MGLASEAPFIVDEVMTGGFLAIGMTGIFVLASATTTAAIHDLRMRLRGKRV
jgi:hypothetical protein